LAIHEVVTTASCVWVSEVVTIGTSMAAVMTGLVENCQK
jgi:hypothetical protein